MNRLLSQDEIMQDLAVFVRISTGSVGARKPHIYRMWGRWWATMRGMNDRSRIQDGPTPADAYRGLWNQARPCR